MRGLRVSAIRYALACALLPHARATAAFAAAVDAAAALAEPNLSCHARDGYDLSGDAAYVWGLGFHVDTAHECCRACAAHARVCSQPGSRRKEWWPRMRCSGKRHACNAFVLA